MIRRRRASVADFFRMPQAEPRVAIIFGASRGIGRQISLSLAGDGYIVVLSSKTTGGSTWEVAPDPNSALSTIDTVLREVQQLGGHGLALPCDVRKEHEVEQVVQLVVKVYGRIDVVIYNPGAVWWSSIDTTPTKRYRLMHDVNVMGLYVAVQELLPVFKRQRKGRIITISPPIYSRFFRGKTAYAMTKVAASIMTLGLGMDLKRYSEVEEHDIAISSLWPAVAIQSAATTRASPDQLRKGTIFGDAILECLRSDREVVNGRFFLDEDFLREHCGYKDNDIDRYALVPGSKPRRMMPRTLPSLEVAEQDDEGQRIDSAKERIDARPNKL